ncbi:type VII secretion protein EccE [Streptomyces gamaensis]|uniref:Type VII secretion protein EccE n=1 Tax=Streptomyces gamaensis TaxID=1763542 RepID=A0ABW0ZB35_9ACTN
MRLYQLVLVEVAAALVLLAWVAPGGGRGLLVAAVAVAALLAVPALVYRGRRPLVEWLVAAHGMRRRVRRSAVGVRSGGRHAAGVPAAPGMPGAGAPGASAAPVPGEGRYAAGAAAAVPDLPGAASGAVRAGGARRSGGTAAPPGAPATADTVIPPARTVAPALAPVVECEPALRTGSFTDRSGRTVGVIGDGTFVTAVLRIDPAEGPLRAPRAQSALPLALLRDGMEVDGIRLESVQVVQHTLPAPAPQLEAEALAARNYAPLHGMSGSPAARLTWVALKLDPELCPDAVAARGGGEAGARRCVLRAADQLASRLRGAGFRAVVLSEGGLAAAVATAANVNPVATAQSDQSVRAGAPARRTAELPRAWRCDDRWHTTYGVGRPPRPGAAPLPQLAASLTSIPALSTTLSVTLGRGRVRDGQHVPTLTGHIRVTGRSADELAASRRELERAARSVRVGLVRLDHEQVPGVLATLPLGGTR